MKCSTMTRSQQISDYDKRMEILKNKDFGIEKQNKQKMNFIGMLNSRFEIKEESVTH